MTDGPVPILLGKIAGGLDHWLTFVGETAGSPTNSTAENALHGSVILHKLIDTLRNERGMFVHEIVLSLLAPRRQQAHKTYDQLHRVVRENEMILPTQAVPEVASG